MIREVLDFWFSARVQPLWFDSTPEFDHELRERFEELVQSAARGELGGWASTAEGSLALVILLDQFPLNIYRGQAKGYALGNLAVDVARKAVEQGFDQQLPRSQVAFLYLPFMHSESLADQDLSVHLFAKMSLKDNLRFAEHHREIIRHFGRFPHRNEALGRESSAAELEYLRSPEAFKG